MKKFILSATLLSLCFLTFSFKPSDKSKGIYDVQIDLNDFNKGKARSFHYDYDVLPNHSKKVSSYSTLMTLTSTDSDIAVLSQALSNY